MKICEVCISKCVQIIVQSKEKLHVNYIRLQCDNYKLSMKKKRRKTKIDKEMKIRFNL